MNREIKFRAYDPDKKLMSFVWEIGFKAWDEPNIDINKIVLEDDGTYEPQNLCRTVLMQFTGLKDKNGIDIYEGDIVEFTFFNQPSIKVCEYYEGRFIFRERSASTYWSLDSNNAKRATIIGNIYETTELFNSIK